MGAGYRLGGLVLGGCDQDADDLLFTIRCVTFLKRERGICARCTVKTGS